MNNVEILGENINRLNVSNRTRQFLKWGLGGWHPSAKIRYNMVTIGDVVSRSGYELLKLRNFGPTTLVDVETALDKLGLKLSERYL